MTLGPPGDPDYHVGFPCDRTVVTGTCSHSAPPPTRDSGGYVLQQVPDSVETGMRYRSKKSSRPGVVLAVPVVPDHGDLLPMLA